MDHCVFVYAGDLRQQKGMRDRRMMSNALWKRVDVADTFSGPENISPLGRGSLVIDNGMNKQMFPCLPTSKDKNNPELMTDMSMLTIWYGHIMTDKQILLSTPPFTLLVHILLTCAPIKLAGGEEANKTVSSWSLICIYYN